MPKVSKALLLQLLFIYVLGCQSNAHAAISAIDGLLNFVSIHTQLGELSPLSSNSAKKIESIISDFSRLTDTKFADADIYYGAPSTEEELLLLDRKNGYLEYLSEGYGVYIIQAAAYRKHYPDTYFFLSDTSGALVQYGSHSAGIKGNDNLRSVLPHDFLKMEDFLPSGYNLPATNEAAFYMAASIPRHGTETVITIKPILLNLYVPYNDFLLITPEDSVIPKNVDETLIEFKNNSYYRYYSALIRSHMLFDPEVFTDTQYPTELPKDKLLALLLSGNITAIGEEDRAILQAFCKENLSSSITLKHLSDRLRFYHAVYRIEQDMVADTLVLNWDKEAARFVLKEAKRVRPKPASFREFLEGDIEVFFSA